jgi:hypothetical protein
VVHVYHLAHPRGFAGNVHIVRALLHTGRHQGAAIQAKWPGAGQHYAGAGSQLFQGGGIVRVSHYDGHTHLGVAQNGF